MKALQFHSWRRSLAFWVVALTIAAAAAMACRRGVPVIDVGPKPLEVDGTISGTVRGPEGTSAVAGRTVAVVNVETGERQTVATSITGGFTFKVKPGRYRVELALQDGEKVVKQPGVIKVNKSDIDAHADFIIGASLHPRLRAPRSNDGLGSAIA
ncbi:MAG: hypothetical protein A3H96_03125 [Acidobacteria bacterium RIFCSPLOWO2_02_FULL_67_36]|nr:MAG: hypothetical protein A3H96_03125 [Acidobacteria bacterium RIFCSPLOWO2_02_FULL_67_36]OFW25183.1 MAG: hypothetical protein A3G21_09095 [Acidobacteria bacterium RIFCSPLOWO2_12_FULL_66_21]